MAFLCSCSGPKMSLDQLLFAATNAAARGKWENCEKYADKALKKNPESADALILKAYAVNAMGDSKKAITIAERASMFGPDNFFVQATYGRLLFKNGQYRAAFTPLSRARRLNSNDPNVLILLAKTTNKLNMASTVAYYNQVAKLREYAESPVPWNEIGCYYAGQKNYQVAARYFIRARTYGADSLQVNLNLGYFLDRWGVFDKAREYYGKFLELAASNPDWQRQCEIVRQRLAQIPNR